MTTKIISLSEDDVIVLKELLDRVRKQPVNPGGKTPPAETLALPTQFVAKAPSAGIAGRVGSQIFNADCTIYRRVSEELIDAGFTRTVWNTALGAVPGDGVVAVWLDSWGTWWTAGVPASDDVETVGTGTAVVTTTITTDPATDTATGPAFVFTGYGVAIDAAGNEVVFDVDDVTIDTDPVTDTATAPFVFKAVGGNLTIDAVGNEVTFTDYPGTGTPTIIETDPATGVASGFSFVFEGVGIGITATAPDRVTFTVPDPAAPTCGEIKIQEVELVCEDRPEPGTGPGDGDLNLYRRNVYLSIVDGCLELVRGPWLFQNTVACCDPTCYTEGVGTGTGTSTGTNPHTPDIPPEGTVSTLCCPTHLLPETLYATFSGGCMNVSIPITYSAIDDQWEGHISGSGGCDNAGVVLKCIAGVWSITDVASFCGPDAVSDPSAWIGLTATRCLPFLLASSGLASLGCGSVTITITE